jgi:outer membrane protein OmpA-like peptidoglycan-associated protein
MGRLHRPPADEEVKMQKIRLSYPAGAIVLVGMILAAGCATKGYVDQQLAPRDQKVEGIETAIEENQKRIREHDERLTTIGTLITQQQADLKSFDGKLEEVKKAAQGTLISKTILQNNDAKFKFGSFELSPEAKAVLDEFVLKLIADNRGVYLEIQGHTDNTGPADYNLILGKRRADAVMEYLYKQHRIPLHRMQVISLGGAAPLADNAAPGGRSQNRRVEILVYE